MFKWLHTWYKNRKPKRKKPIPKPATTSKVRKPAANALRKMREYNAQKKFERNLAKEREIGVHPKYRNSYRRQWSPDAKSWEALERKWETNNV